MSNANNAKTERDVPVLAEVAQSSSSQRLSGDLVTSSLVSKSASKSNAKNQGVAFEQVRELLMGETIATLREDLNTSHRIILQRVDALGSSASEQLEVLEEKVATLSSDVAAEVTTRKAFAVSHRQSMEISATELKRELAEFKLSAQHSMEKLTEDVHQQSRLQASAVASIEEAMNTQLLEKGKSLGNTTVAKDQLAAILFDAAATFADSGSDKDSEQKTDNKSASNA